MTNHGRRWTTVDTTSEVKCAMALAAWSGTWVRDEEAKLRGAVEPTAELGRLLIKAAPARTTDRTKTPTWLVGRGLHQGGWQSMICGTLLSWSPMPTTWSSRR